MTDAAPEPDPSSAPRPRRSALRSEARHASRLRLTGRRGTPGSAPGTTPYTGGHAQPAPRIRLIRYDASDLVERDLAPEEAVAAIRDGGAGVRWLDVSGLADAALLARLGEALELHPLWLEDVVNVGQRPKLEAASHALLVVLRALRSAQPDHGLAGASVSRTAFEAEQISLVLGDGLVVTFQERAGDAFEPVRERIRAGRGRIREAGADYLAYALIDMVVEELFVLLERYGDDLEGLEDEVFRAPKPEHLQRINAIRQEALQLRRAAWPTRDLIASLLREESPLLGNDTRIFLRDVHDHAVQAMDAVETLRELLAGLQDATMSTLSFRMNEVMRVLTVIGTVFIPLTFVVGVYGMNFEVMPELRWPWAYPVLWLFMLSLAATMLSWFGRKGWLQRP